MRKSLKIILCNIFIFVFLFFILDFVAYYVDKSVCNTFNHPGLKDYIENLTRDTSQKRTYEENVLGKNFCYRPVVNPSSSKKPILLFGCSFAWGHKLPLDKNLAGVLGSYTGRPIYNRASFGWSVQHMLYQLQSEEFYRIIPEPEYVIYTFIDAHISRMWIPVGSYIKNYYGVYYRKNNDHLELKKRTVWERFALVFVVKSWLYSCNFLNMYSDEVKKEFLKMHFIESQKEIKKHWKNTKFVILEYENERTFDSIKNDLTKEGIVIVDKNELINFEREDLRYCISEKDSHPNEKAWATVVPLLIKQLGL